MTARRPRRSTTSTRPVVPPMLEDPWQTRVIDTALYHRWLVFHALPALIGDGTNRRITHFRGHKGFPDLVLARNSTALFVELKSTTGRLEPEQAVWRDALGEQWRLWTPADWPAVEAELSTGRPGVAPWLARRRAELALEQSAAVTVNPDGTITAHPNDVITLVLNATGAAACR